MEQLVILDYTNATVDIYDIDPEVDITDDYIDSLGHNPNNCFWMIGEDIEVIKHRYLLK